MEIHFKFISNLKLLLELSVSGKTNKMCVCLGGGEENHPKMLEEIPFCNLPKTLISSNNSNPLSTGTTAVVHHPVLVLNMCCSPIITEWGADVLYCCRTQQHEEQYERGTSSRHSILIQFDQLTCWPWSRFTAELTTTWKLIHLNLSFYSQASSPFIKSTNYRRLYLYPVLWAGSFPPFFREL